MYAVFGWIIGSTPGRIIIGAVAFLAWLTWHDHKIAERAKDQVQAQAGKEAAERITNLEKNNADFRNLPAHDRCVVFMRDSGLPIDNCP